MFETTVKHLECEGQCETLLITQGISSAYLSSKGRTTT